MIKHHTKVRYRYKLAVDGVNESFSPRVFCRVVKHHLVSKKIKVNPFRRFAASTTTQHALIKRSGGDQIIDGNSQVEGC